MKNNEVTLAYFGTSVIKITTSRGKKILIDPYITKNQLCRQPLSYFYDADLILVTHAAFDHFGDTVDIMKNSKATLFCGGELVKYCLDIKLPKERMKSYVYGAEKEYDGIRVKAVDARHASRLDADTGTYYGFPMGYVITTENGVRIYHAGDTSLIGDMRNVGMLQMPHILLLGVSCVLPGYAVEMSPTELALATLWVAPDVVVPMHYPAGSDEPKKFCDLIRQFAPTVEPVLLEPNSQMTYTRYAVKANAPLDS